MGSCRMTANWDLAPFLVREGLATTRPLFSNEALSAYFSAITPLAVTERRHSLCSGVIPPTCDSRRKIRACDLFRDDFSWNDHFEPHRVGVREDRAKGFRRRHLQFLAVIFADQNGVFVGNLELDTNKCPDWAPLQLSRPLMGRREVGDDWHRVNSLDS
jgi:hypothetical protein